MEVMDTPQVPILRPLATFYDSGDWPPSVRGGGGGGEGCKMVVINTARPSSIVGLDKNMSWRTVYSQRGRQSDDGGSGGEDCGCRGRNGGGIDSDGCIESGSRRCGSGGNGCNESGSGRSDGDGCDDGGCSSGDRPKGRTESGGGCSDDNGFDDSGDNGCNESESSRSGDGDGRDDVGGSRSAGRNRADEKQTRNIVCRNDKLKLHPINIGCVSKLPSTHTNHPITKNNNNKTPTTNRSNTPTTPSNSTTITNFSNTNNPSPTATTNNNIVSHMKDSTSCSQTEPNNNSSLTAMNAQRNSPPRPTSTTTTTTTTPEIPTTKTAPTPTQETATTTSAEASNVKRVGPAVDKSLFLDTTPPLCSDNDDDNDDDREMTTVTPSSPSSSTTTTVATREEYARGGGGEGGGGGERGGGGGGVGPIRNLRVRGQRQVVPGKTRHKRQTLQDMTRPLKQWLIRHRDNPYPSKEEKMFLVTHSHMTLTQVSNWFANARRRLKNTVKQPDLTWAARIKLYDSCVQGNAELFAIGSGDSGSDSEEDMMDHQQSDTFHDDVTECLPSSRTASPDVTTTSGESRVGVTQLPFPVGNKHGGSNSVSVSQPSVPDTSSQYSFYQPHRSYNSTNISSNNNTSSNSSNSSVMSSSSQRGVTPPRTSSSSSSQYPGLEETCVSFPKYKHSILQRYLSDSHQQALILDEDSVSKSRDRHHSSSTGSRDLEELSTSSVSSPSHEFLHHDHLDDFSEEFETMALWKRASNISAGGGGGEQEEMYWKEIGAALALTSLARRSRTIANVT